MSVKVEIDYNLCPVLKYFNFNDENEVIPAGNIGANNFMDKYYGLRGIKYTWLTYGYSVTVGNHALNPYVYYDENTLETIKQTIVDIIPEEWEDNWSISFWTNDGKEYQVN